MISFFILFTSRVSSGQTDIVPSSPDRIVKGSRTVSGDMVRVKGGCFKMGDIFRDVPSSEKPVHEVCVDDFFMGRHEVTVGDFRRFVNETGYRTDAERQDGCTVWTEGREEKKMDASWKNTGFSQTERHPVVCISWSDSKEYIRWLNDKEGKNFRLPTEAEWEYAARSGGRDHQYSWGKGQPSGNIADESAKETLPGQAIWAGYNDGYAYTAPTGSFRPNDLGLHDMSGNVYEWIEDWYVEDFYKNSPKNNPVGYSGEFKILRGGAWDLEPGTTRTSSRYWNIPGARAVCIGFRLAHPAGELERQQ